MELPKLSPSRRDIADVTSRERLSQPFRRDTSSRLLHPSGVSDRGSILAMRRLTSSPPRQQLIDGSRKQRLPEVLQLESDFGPLFRETLANKPEPIRREGASFALPGST